MKYLPVLLLFLFFWLGCKEQKDDFTFENGFEYFPLEVGNYKIYQVDSVIYDPASGGINRDSSRTFIKETLIEKYSDDAGAEVFKIERAQRNTPADPWTITNIWTTSHNELRAYRTEENLKFVPLVFPVQARKRWNSLVFTDPALQVEIAGEPIEIFKGWSSEIESADQAEKIGDFDFEKVTMVIHADEENLIELRSVIEKYAKGVGLVFKEMKILDTQCISPCEGQPWEEKAEKGFILRQVLIESN